MWRWLPRCQCCSFVPILWRIAQKTLTMEGITKSMLAVTQDWSMIFNGPKISGRYLEDSNSCFKRVMASWKLINHGCYAKDCECFKTIEGTKEIDHVLKAHDLTEYTKWTDHQDSSLIWSTSLYWFEWYQLEGCKPLEGKATYTFLLRSRDLAQGLSLFISFKRCIKTVIYLTRKRSEHPWNLFTWRAY